METINWWEEYFLSPFFAYNYRQYWLNIFDVQANQAFKAYMAASYYERNNHKRIYHLWNIEIDLWNFIESEREWRSWNETKSKLEANIIPRWSTSDGGGLEENYLICPMEMRYISASFIDREAICPLKHVATSEMRTSSRLVRVVEGS